MKTNDKLVEIDHVKARLIEVINDFFGCDAAYYGINPLDMATHLIANGVTVQEWIPVTERLPDEDVRVIVRIDRTVWNTTFELDADRRHNGDWVRWGRAVTDWMPLPEPPKEDD